MRALVVGVDGLVGGALAVALRARGDEVHATTRRPAAGDAGKTWSLDLAADTRRVELPSVDVAVICAAVTSLAACRADPDGARRVNLDAPAQLAARWGARTVFLSTNAVFDCREPLMRADRQRDPGSVYGRLKAAAEDAVLAQGGIVVRLTKIFGADVPLLRRWHDALRRGERVEAAADHRVAPVALDHVTDSLLAIATHGGGGIYQVSASGDVAYDAIAGRIADRLGIDRSQVEPRAAIDLGIPAGEVLSYTSLDASRLAALTGRAPPSPDVAIDRVLSRLN